MKKPFGRSNLTSRTSRVPFGPACALLLGVASPAWAQAPAGVEPAEDTDSEATSSEAIAGPRSEATTAPGQSASTVAAPGAAASSQGAREPAQPGASGVSAVTEPALVPAATEPPKTAAVATVTAEPGKGFTITTADDRFSLGLRPRVQIRETFVHDAKGDTNELNVKTVRLTSQGHVLDRDLKYTLQLAFGGGDFEAGSSSPVLDAFVEYVGVRDANLRFGQFFVPFDRARTVRESALQFADRPQVVRELTLDRDVGLMLSSTDLFGSKVLGYHAFLGAGDGKNRFGAQDPGVLAVARLVLRPWGTFDDDQEADLKREARPRLALGVAGAYNYKTNRQNSTYGTTLSLGTPSYTNAAVDLVFKSSGLSILAEVLARHSDDESFSAEVDSASVTEYTRSGWGYLAQAGFMLSSAFELTGRWEKLLAESDTDPALRTLADTQGDQLAAGLNYYINGHAFKVQADYTFIDGKRAEEARHIARLQLDASF